MLRGLPLVVEPLTGGGQLVGERSDPFLRGVSLVAQALFDMSAFVVEAPARGGELGGEGGSSLTSVGETGLHLDELVAETVRVSLGAGQLVPESADLLGGGVRPRSLSVELDRRSGRRGLRRVGPGGLRGGGRFGCIGTTALGGERRR